MAKELIKVTKKHKDWVHTAIIIVFLYISPNGRMSRDLIKFVRLNVLGREKGSFIISVLVLNTNTINQIKGTITAIVTIHVIMDTKIEIKLPLKGDLVILLFLT
jgi:hypothetical protein